MNGIVWKGKFQKTEDEPGAIGEACSVYCNDPAESKTSKGHGPRYDSKGHGSPASAQFHLPEQIRRVRKLDAKRLVDLDHGDVSVTMMDGGKKAISPSTTLS